MSIINLVSIQPAAGYAGSVLFFPCSVKFSFYKNRLQVLLTCMKHSTKKTVLLSILLLILLGVSAGIYLYNKGPIDIKRSRALPVEATALYAAFTTDSIKANQKYGSKVVLVTGEVSEISVNSKQQQIILIKTLTGGAYVNCTLAEPAANIAVATPISIKGICGGIGEGDIEMGVPGDVYLTRCIVEPKN